MSLKIAILDLYDGHPNQGMRCIQDIIITFSQTHHTAITYQIFKVRDQNELPDTSFDVYISSGGPGSPVDSEGTEWENNFFKLMDDLEAINNDPAASDKKYVFFICHSFQLMCRKYKLGNVTKRNSTSFGIFPIHKTTEGQFEEIFSGLEDPFYTVDSRDWQVIQPNEENFEAMGAKILAIEKERPHVDLERCIMSIRFSEYFFGTQFHPEADPIGMKEHLQNEEKKKIVIEAHGEEKYYEMMHFLEHPEKLERTQSQILPAFLHQAINALQEA